MKSNVGQDWLDCLKRWSYVALGDREVIQFVPHLWRSRTSPSYQSTSDISSPCTILQSNRHGGCYHKLSPYDYSCRTPGYMNASAVYCSSLSDLRLGRTIGFTYYKRIF
ncbi:hypothetical protein HZ326_22199 [Fusarium oxysporum f. sp. albedinis]|nr:hypothetical protein HZ326_22199 [Fusarium oxysporum f. sp. albedinis]